MQKSTLFGILYLIAFFYFLPNAVALAWPASHVRIDFLNCQPSDNEKCEITGMLKRDWKNLDHWAFIEDNSKQWMIFKDKTLGVDWIIYNLETQ